MTWGWTEVPVWAACVGAWDNALTLQPFHDQMEMGIMQNAMLLFRTACFAHFWIQTPNNMKKNMEPREKQVFFVIMTFIKQEDTKTGNQEAAGLGMLGS